MNNYKRKKPSRLLHNKILILCGGETEEIYFTKFKQKYKSALNNVTVKVCTGKHADPISLVKEAISLQNEYNNIWCVFDKDDFTHFDEAIEMTSKCHNVKCAFSNEAIEYWFILHFSDKNGELSRKKLNKMLSQYFGISYDKKRENIEKVCEKLLTLSIDIAEERAKRGYEHHKANSGKKYSEWCSCTTIFVLTRNLRRWVEAK